jgi:hypothetical protein
LPSGPTIFLRRYFKGQGQLCLGHVTVHTSKVADELPSQPFDEKKPLPKKPQKLQKPLIDNDSNPKTLFESFIGNFSPERLKTESFIESFSSVFLLVE